jgi:hypothetical protein
MIRAQITAKPSDKCKDWAGASERPKELPEDFIADNSKAQVTLPKEDENGDDDTGSN